MTGKLYFSKLHVDKLFQHIMHEYIVQDERWEEQEQERQ